MARKVLHIPGPWHGDQPIPPATKTGPIVTSGGVSGMDPETGNTPDDVEEQQAARHRLAFDELLLLQLAVLMRKREWQQEDAGIPLEVRTAALDGFTAALPFALTGAQARVLGEVLDEVSTFYTQQLRQTVKTVTSMIEPLMIMIMGGVVGFIAMAIILPIFKLSTLVN